MNRHHPYATGGYDDQQVRRSMSPHTPASGRSLRFEERGNRSTRGRGYNRGRGSSSQDYDGHMSYNAHNAASSAVNHNSVGSMPLDPYSYGAPETNGYGYGGVNEGTLNNVKTPQTMRQLFLIYDIVIPGTPRGSDSTRCGIKFEAAMSFISTLSFKDHIAFCVFQSFVNSC